MLQLPGLRALAAWFCFFVLATSVAAQLPNKDAVGGAVDAVCPPSFMGFGGGTGVVLFPGSGDARSGDPVQDDGSEEPSPTYADVSTAGGVTDFTGGINIEFIANEAPGLAGMTLGQCLLYRSHTTVNAASWLDTQWHLTVLDKVVLPLNGSNLPTGVTWTTGTGQVISEGPSYEVPPESVEVWIPLSNSFSQFRYILNGGTATLERYARSGAVTRYELASGTTWRPKSWFDAYDNEWTYDYDTQGRLLKTTDPRGVETRYVWSSQVCTVERWLGTTHYSEFDWTFELDAGDRVVSIGEPVSAYVTPGSGSVLHDLGSATSDSREYTFDYDTTSGMLKTVRDSRFGGAVVLSNTYVLFGGKYRVQSQSDHEAGPHSYAYAIASGSGNLVTTYTDPIGTEYEFEVEDGRRVVSYTVSPDAATGQPRAAAGDSPVEPASLTWTMTYGGCVCDKPTSIVTPSGSTWTYAYDSLGRTTSATYPSPTGSGAETAAWTYEGLLRAGRPLTSVPPAGGVQLTHTYSWQARSSGLAGEKPSSRITVSSPISDIDGGNQILTSTIQLDAAGRVTDTIDVGGTQHEFSYVASGSGQDLLDYAERVGAGARFRVEVDQDDMGRVSRIGRGTPGNMAETHVTHDGLGRAVLTSQSPGGGQPASVAESYYDQYGNRAVFRRLNRNHANAQVKYEDGTGGGRDWVRVDWIYFGHRLLDSYVDRAPLPSGSNIAAPTGGANPWMARYQFGYDQALRLTSVIMPGGQVSTSVLDGYGMLYKSISDAGGLNVESQRSFYDSDLVLSESRQLTEAGWASTQLQRNNGGHGVVYRMTDATGVIAESTFDALGRSLGVTVKNGAGPVERSWSRTYDQLGRVTRQRSHLLDGSGGILETSFLYNVRSQVLRVDGPVGRQAFRDYDAFGRLERVRDNLSSGPAEWNQVSLAYVPGRNFLASITSSIVEDQGGTSIRRDYKSDFIRDTLGRVLERKMLGLVGGAQSALVHSFDYNSLGMVERTQSPEQQGAANRYTHLTYDADGRWVEYVKREAADSIRLTSHYTDHTPKPEFSRFDGMGRSTRFEYDEIYRLVGVYRPGYAAGSGFHRTLMTYTPDSRVDLAQDGNGTLIDHSYDLAGRLLQRSVTPGSGVSFYATAEIFDYSGIGVLESIETRFGPGGANSLVHVAQERDSVGRLEREAFAFFGVTGATTADITSGYAFGGSSTGDVVRRSIGYSTSGFGQDIGRDILGRPDSVDVTPPGAPAAFTAVSYRYNGGVAHHRQVTVGSGGPQFTRTIELDGHRRLDSLGHERGAVSQVRLEFGWADSGVMTSKSFVGGKIDGSGGDLFDYDHFERLTGSKLGVPAAQMGGGYGAATSAREVGMALDDAQNRISQVETIAGVGATTTSYTTHAASNRYSSEQIGSTTTNFLYDGEGNLVFDGDLFYIYDFKNRLSEVYRVAGESAQAQSGGGAALTASAVSSPSLADLQAGRAAVLDTVGGCAVTLCRKAADGLGNGEVVARRVPVTGGSAPQSGSTAQSVGGSGSSSSTATYELVAIYGYDPMNRRVARVTAEDLRYTYDGWHEAEELVVSEGVLSARSVELWGVATDESVLSYEWDGAAWQVAHHLQDEQGSRIAGYDASSATPASEVEFKAFGGVHAASALVSASRFRYKGMRSDEETGLYYARNRYYHVRLGRFLTQDPLGSWGDPNNLGNAYAFVGNSPTIWSDPSGLHSIGTPSGAGSTIGIVPGGGAGVGVGGGGLGSGGCGMPGLGLAGSGWQDPKKNQCFSTADLWPWKDRRLLESLPFLAQMHLMEHPEEYHAMLHDMLMADFGLHGDPLFMDEYMHSRVLGQTENHTYEPPPEPPSDLEKFMEVALLSGGFVGLGPAGGAAVGTATVVGTGFRAGAARAGGFALRVGGVLARAGGRAGRFLAGAYRSARSWCSRCVLRRAPLTGGFVRSGSTSLYHRGMLTNGVVSGARPLSTSTSTALTHYMPNGRTYLFQVPNSVLSQWEAQGLLRMSVDSFKGISVTEFKFLGSAASQLNRYLVGVL